MNKSTLYITFDGLSDPLGQSQIIPYLCGIASQGYHIHILSCEKKNRLQAEHDVIKKKMANLPISWEYIHYDSGAGFLSRFAYIREISAMARAIAKKEKIALVHCRSYLASLVGLELKRKFKIPFVFDMRGFWANERIDGGIWKKSNPLHLFFYRYFKAKEKRFLAESNAIVSLTHKAVKELDTNFSKFSIPGKTTVIPCCTNASFFDPAQVQAKQVEGIQENDHVIVYTGSIGTWYYTKEIIDCMLSWRKLIPNVRLLIVTKDRDELEKVLSLYPTHERSVVVTASATYSEVPKYLARAKAAIFFIKPAYSKMASSPTKMAECWAMNLPVITNAGIGDNDHFFGMGNAGVLVNEFKQEEYLRVGEKYLELSKTNNDYRSIALKYFDNKRAIEWYTTIYDKLSAG